MVLANLLAAAKNAIVEWHNRRVAYEELMSLSDRSLADIGISRSQVRSIVYGEPSAEQPQPAERPALPARGHAKLAA